MNYIEQIKSGIEKLYKANPNIHISVIKRHPKVVVNVMPAKIVGVYRNIFQVEECEDGKTPKRYTHQYTDVLIGQVKIEELDYAPMENTLKKN